MGHIIHNTEQCIVVQCSCIFRSSLDRNLRVKRRCCSVISQTKSKGRSFLHFWTTFQDISDSFQIIRTASELPGGCPNYPLSLGMFQGGNLTNSPKVQCKVFLILGHIQMQQEGIFRSDPGGAYPDVGMAAQIEILTLYNVVHAFKGGAKKLSLSETGINKEMRIMHFPHINIIPHHRYNFSLR